MKNYVFIFGVLCLTFIGISQESITDSLPPDNQYSEDQFYLAVTYNILTHKPDKLSQSGFSSGLHAGFIRDFPINKKRNIALGIGMGYAVSTFNQNMLIYKDEQGNTQFTILNQAESGYTKNKFATHAIEIPIEIRWRNSSPTRYSFWRVYTGFKLGYVFAHGTKFKGELGSFKYTDIEAFNEFQYGLTLSFGYQKWNAHLYYGLNEIFDNTANSNDKPINMAVAKIGLIFYIL